MLVELDVELETEQDRLGQPSVWREVYRLIRYPGPL
jgi:hypothetical protein